MSYLATAWLDYSTKYSRFPFNVTKGCFVLLQTSVVLTEEYNVVVNSEEFIGTTECLTLYARCRINCCRYNRVDCTSFSNHKAPYL